MVGSILVRTLLASAFVGCGTSNTNATAVAELGTGIDIWEPLALDEVYLVEGPQGGRHVIGNVRMDGMDPGTTRANAPKTRFDMFKLDGSRVSTDLPPFSLAFVDCPDGGYMLPYGRYVFVDLPAAEILETVVELNVELEDSEGHTARDSMLVTVKPYVSN